PEAHQRVYSPVVEELQVDAPAQFAGRAVPLPGLPPRDDQPDRAPADVLNRAQPEPDPALADHGELEPRLVHVGRQHFEAELSGLVDVLHDLVAVADFG